MQNHEIYVNGKKVTMMETLTLIEAIEETEEVEQKRSNKLLKRSIYRNVIEYEI